MNACAKDYLFKSNKNIGEGFDERAILLIERRHRKALLKVMKSNKRICDLRPFIRQSIVNAAVEGPGYKKILSKRIVYKKNKLRVEERIYCIFASFFFRFVEGRNAR